MDTPKRYHPLSVILHWLTVILILGAGFLSESGSSLINIHMILGSLLLVTLIVRLIVRFTVKRPAWANTGSQFLNKLGGVDPYRSIFCRILHPCFRRVDGIPKEFVGLFAWHRLGCVCQHQIPPRTSRTWMDGGPWFVIPAY